MQKQPTHYDDSPGRILRIQDDSSYSSGILMLVDNKFDEPNDYLD